MILVKYPSRGRPERFFESLDTAYNTASPNIDFKVLVTLDEDDATMNNEGVIGRLMQYPNLHWIFGVSTSKVNAINRDMEHAGDWDIVVVLSDDMLFCGYGWNVHIDEAFESAPNGNDTLLHMPDQDAGAVLAVMYIAGRCWYMRWNYIYNPIYKSLFCDNEIGAIAKQLGCYLFVNTQIVLHLNPAYGHLPKDRMFEEQQIIGYLEDQATYNLRVLQNFDL